MMHIFDLLQLFNDTGAEGPGVTGEVAQPQETSADPDAEFESLIRGKYKDAYDTRVRDTIHKRLKGSRETVEKYNALTPALRVLANHYGVDASDAAALSRAVEGDDSFFRREAERRGMGVRELRAIQSLERENAVLRSAYTQRSRNAYAQQQFDAWSKQGEALKEQYPDFDMNTEVQNPRFRQLLMSGLKVEEAHLLLHRQEILEQAARDMHSRIANSMQHPATRPPENGTGGRSSAITKSDVASMSRADREAIRRRAARGERIKF